MNKANQTEHMNKKAWTKPELQKVELTMSHIEGLSGSNAETVFTSQPTS